MIRRPIKEVNAEFIAEEKYLDGIRRTVRESCVAAGMPKKDVTAVLLAIEEGATNIIRHAYLYEKGTIRLRIVIYRRLIVFSLMDTGRSFQPDGTGRVDLQRLVESARKGGLGFYMIQKIMDSVEYISSVGLNELRMIRRIGPFRPESRPFLRRLSTLRAKFSVATFAVVAVIIGAAYYYIDYRTTRHLYSHLDETVRALAKTIADQAAGYVINRRSDVEFDELIVSYLRANPELELIVLTDSLGSILAHSEDIRNIRKPYNIPPSLEADRLNTPQRYRVQGESQSYLMLPIRSGGTGLGRVHVSYSSAPIGDRIAEARWRIALLTLVLLLFGVAGIYFLSNYFVRPIVNITRRVRRFASGDLETELPLEGAEEFFEISRAFNEMITRLSRDRRNIVAREKMAKEIEVASQIQKALLPRQLPTIPGLEVDAFYRAAETVGGDLYDIFAITPERYCLAVADVSGKGVPASLVMSILRTVIQIQSAQAVSAKQILIKVNDYMRSNMPPGMFITVLLVVYESASREVNFVSAGHNPMLLYSGATGKITKVNPAGMPLGMPATLGPHFEERLEEKRFTLADGDALLIFTDGITEATDRGGQQYGIDRLAGLVAAELARSGTRTANSVTRAIVGDLDDFSGFARQSDDITFVIARARAPITEDEADSEPLSPEEREIETRQVERTDSGSRDPG